MRMNKHFAHENQLNLSLFSYDEVVEKPVQSQVSINAINVPVNTIERSYDWTDQEVLLLKEALLFDSLSVIKDKRSSKARKAEILAWIDLNDKHSPFSFLNCCEAFNCDHEVLRTELIIKITNE